jgi:hypothetical protein
MAEREQQVRKFPIDLNDHFAKKSEALGEFDFAERAV